MAREAKVGLLLGLVFIVAIAIVLRGVHETSPAQLEQSLGISSETVKPLEMESLSVAVESLAPRQAEVVQPTGGTGQRNVVPPSPTLTEQREPATFRHEQELPRAPYVQINPLERERVASGKEELPESVVNALNKLKFNPVKLITPKTKNQAKASIYVVREGDDLSRIALKVYGREQGKRWVNVERIYKANRKILPSADMVREGQRLKIPPLALEMASQQMQQIQPPAQPKHVEKKRNAYQVKEGDSLWKIAERHLGNGGRYNEIMQLNSKTLWDEDNLFVGMRLTLPVN
jgi:nucleoid-associated protein YgaU